MTTHPDVFDQIVLVADQRLGTDPVDDVFRASVISGAACARSVVERIEPIAAGWDAENQIGAALLTEFWSAVIASRLLGAVEGREEVLTAITERFSGGVFGSSASALAWSLQTFEDQLMFGQPPDAETPVANAMTWYYLYWRSRDLLLGDPPLQGQFHPAADLDAWRSDERHRGVEPPLDPEGPTLAREILLWGLESASQHFAALRQAAEEHESEVIGGPSSAGPGDVGHGSDNADEREMADGQIEG